MWGLRIVLSVVDLCEKQDVTDIVASLFYSRLISFTHIIHDLDNSLKVESLYAGSVNILSYKPGFYCM